MSPTKYYGILITLICIKLPKGSSKVEWNEVMNENDDVSDQVYQVEAVLGKTASLPCDIELKDRFSAVSVVLWFRKFDHRPIYRYDARGRDPGQEKHWSDKETLGPRAYFVTLSQPAVLQVDNVQLRDEGVYRCRVDYQNAPTRNFQIHLTVVVPPHQMILYDHSGIEIQDRIGPLYENGDLSLLCEVRGGKPAPNVTWLLNDTRLENQVVFADTNIVISKLELKNLTRAYSDNTYTCMAFNTNLIAPIQKTTKLGLYLKPLRVRIAHKYEELKAHQIYSLVCETSGSKPSAVISWWINKSLLNATQIFYNGTDDLSTQMIHYEFKPQHDKLLLRCEATNPKIDESKLEDSFTLNILYPPIVSLQLGNKLDSNYIKESDDVYFECRNRANPLPSKVIWFHNEKRIYQNISNGIILSGESLVLQSITRLYSGSYTCQVINSEGETNSAAVLLRVKYAPVCHNKEAAVVGTSLGDVVNVVCSVDADPAVTNFKWVLNNSAQSLIVPAEKYVILNSTASNLSYKLISNRDFGTLTCRTKNAIGEQTTPCTFFVVKAVHPSGVDNCTFHHIKDDTRPLLDIRCKPGYSGGVKQSFHLEISNQNKTLAVLNVTEAPYFRIELWKLVQTWHSENLQFTLYSSNVKGRSESVVYEQNFPRELWSKFAEEFVVPKEHQNFQDFLMLIIVGSIGVLLTSFLFLIVLVRKCCSTSIRKSIDCDREIKSAMTKINADTNEEQYLISYQFDNAKPDILNKVVENNTNHRSSDSELEKSSLISPSLNGENQQPLSDKLECKYSIFVTTSGSKNEQAVTCKKLYPSCDTLFGPESSV